jgi:hypothetical protein
MRLNRAVPILLVGLIAAVLTRNTVAQESSTPEERTQWVQVTHKLESGRVAHPFYPDMSIWRGPRLTSFEAGWPTLFAGGILI